MNVRLATIADLSSLSAFATEWMTYQVICQGFNFDHNIFQRNLLAMIQAQGVLLAEEHNKIIGGIGGRVVTSYYSADIIFDVVMIYLEPEYRKFSGQLFKALEDILKRTTVTKIVIANPAFKDWSKQQRFYKMKGYHLLQSSLVKTIKTGATNAS
jgi:GNAT superfamily N-acetyltransferase